MTDTMREAFEAWFEKQWPDHAAVLTMYAEGSQAVDALDTIFPRRIKQATEMAYAAGAAAQKARDVEICNGYLDADYPDCAQDIIDDINSDHEHT